MKKFGRYKTRTVYYEYSDGFFNIFFITSNLVHPIESWSCNGIGLRCYINVHKDVLQYLYPSFFNKIGLSLDKKSYDNLIEELVMEAL